MLRMKIPSRERELLHPRISSLTLETEVQICVQYNAQHWSKSVSSLLAVGTQSADYSRLNFSILNIYSSWHLSLDLLCTNKSFASNLLWFSSWFGLLGCLSLVLDKKPGIWILKVKSYSSYVHVNILHPEWWDSKKYFFNWERKSPSIEPRLYSEDSFALKSLIRFSIFLCF